MERDSLRRAMRQMRLGMAECERMEASEACARRILGLPQYRSARSVMAYVAIRGELDLGAVIQDAHRSGRALYLPRVMDSRSMRALLHQPGGALVCSQFGVPEPAGGAEMAADRIDLILVPGVAFDRMGGRLGYGAGYYDAFLAGSGRFKLGVCYDRQIVPEIALHPADVRMDALVTQSKYEQFRGGHT